MTDKKTCLRMACVLAMVFSGTTLLAQQNATIEVDDQKSGSRDSTDSIRRLSGAPSQRRL